MHLIKILGHANSSLQNLDTIMFLIMQGVQKSLCCCHILMFHTLQVFVHEGQKQQLFT